MNINADRFYKFIKRDKTRSFLAFLFYFLCILTFYVEPSWPLLFQFIYYIALITVTILGCNIYMIDSVEKILEQRKKKIGKKIKTEFKKIVKEIIMFIPVLLLSIFLSSQLFLILGGTVNQASIRESFKKAPIFYSILLIIIAPIIEEYIFRSLPYKFIKNKILYIIISTVVFASVHVINDPKFYMILYYIPKPLYYGYRYHKTKDIFVTISMHSLNNFISVLPMIALLFL